MGSKYTSGRPTQEVRLRNWPAGQAAQMKHAVSLLETELNRAIAEQTDQGTARKFSSRVPRITGLVVRAGFKNFQISFNEAKGISNLLFYEIEKANDANFATSRSFKQPQTTLTIPTETENETIFVRVRAINTKFEVGPWSNTETQIGSSNFRINVTKTTPFETTIDKDSTDWTNIVSIVHNPIFGSVCLNCHAGVFVYDDRDLFSGTNPLPGEPRFVSQEDQNVGVTFRFTRDGVAIPGEYTTCAKSHNQVDSVDENAGRSEMSFIASMVSPFESFTGVEASVTYTLQAKVHPSSTSHKLYNDNSTDDFTVGLNDPKVRVDIFELLSIIQVSL